MDRESANFQYQLSQSQDEPEFGFEDTFPTLEHRPPILGLPDTQHGSFGRFQRDSGVPIFATGGHSAPVTMGRMTYLGGSFGSGPYGNVSWAGSNSTSPPQRQPVGAGQRSFHVSPMLHPLASTDVYFPEEASTSMSGTFMDDVTSGFMSDSSSWTAQSSFGPGMAMSEPGSALDQMTDDVLQLFHGQNMVHAIAASPVSRAHEASSGFGAMNMDVMHDVPQNVSPMLLPQDGSMHTQTQLDHYHLDSSIGGSVSPSGVSPLLGPIGSSYDSGSVADFPMLSEIGSANSSPALQPRDKSRRRSSPSTASQMNFVSVEPVHSQGRPVAVRNNSRRATGRKGPLASSARAKAARMRQVGVCGSCKKRKASCDPELYCKSCIRHLGVEVINSPCRGRILSDLAKDFIQGGIFPTARTLDSFFLGRQYNRTSQVFNVKLKIGFGPSIPVQVYAVVPDPCAKVHLHHNHVVYQWPLRAKQATEKRKYYHQVFPAVLTTTVGFKVMLHQHLGRLVDDHFDDFPHHRSQLTVLRPFHKFYKSLTNDDEPRRLIKEAFKLLVLVHIGGDLQMDATDEVSRVIVRRFFGWTGEASCRDDFSTCPRDMGNFPTPCFIRGQLGSLMPALAHEMMVDILHRVERMSLGQKCDVWPHAIVTFGVILMAVESIDYHKQKLGFHARLDTDMRRSHSEPSRPIPCGPQPPPATAASSSAEGTDTQPSVAVSASDHACDQLVGFYRACFPNCHGRLAKDVPARKRSGSSSAAAVAAGQQEAQNTLVAELRAALSNAGEYLLEKKKGDGSGAAPSSMAAPAASDDLSVHFDRRLANFFVPNVEVAF